MTETSDHIVVGGGTASRVVAARLASEGEAKVLLLEAGHSHRHPLLDMPPGIRNVCTSDSAEMHSIPSKPAYAAKSMRWRCVPKCSRPQSDLKNNRSIGFIPRPFLHGIRSSDSIGTLCGGCGFPPGAQDPKREPGRSSDQRIATRDSSGSGVDAGLQTVAPKPEQGAGSSNREAQQSVGQLSFQALPASNPQLNCPTLCGSLRIRVG